MIYRVPFSKIYNLESKIQILKETFKPNETEEVFQILKKDGIRERLLRIPLFLKVFGLKAINIHWKIYYEKKILGVELESSFVKSMTFEEIENFLEILNGIAAEINSEF